MMPVYYDEDEPDANNRWKKLIFSILMKIINDTTMISSNGLMQ